MKECKYATSTQCVTNLETGRKVTYHHCDVCGQEHRSEYGAYYDFNMCSSFSTIGRFKVCHRCGQKLAPLVQDFFETLRKDMAIIKQTAPAPKNRLTWNGLPWSLLDPVDGDAQPE